MKKQLSTTVDWRDCAEYTIACVALRNRPEARIGGTAMDPVAWQHFADTYQPDLEGSRQIMVIDDNTRRSEALSMCLWTIYPFAVRSLTTAQAMREEIESVDVVLVSMEMPNTDRLA